MFVMPIAVFGRGFMTSKVKSKSSPVYPVDLKNGMPVISYKKKINNIILRKNNMVNGDLAAKGD